MLKKVMHWGAAALLAFAITSTYVRSEEPQAATVCVTFDALIAKLGEKPHWDLQGLELQAFNDNFSKINKIDPPANDRLAVFGPKNDNVLVTSFVKGCLDNSFIAPEDQFTAILYGDGKGI